MPIAQHVICDLWFIDQPKVWSRKFTRGAQVQSGFFLDGTNWPKTWTYNVLRKQYGMQKITYSVYMVERASKQRTNCLTSIMKRTELHRQSVIRHSSLLNGCRPFIQTFYTSLSPLLLHILSFLSFFHFKRGDGWVYKRIWPWIDFCFALSVASWLCQLQGAPSWRLWLF